ncbi:MAG: D-alanyl-D-alanine carboxypeptidase/D-alanyl-D-alanine-endopeptidase [Candidatus Kapaibacteriales bacterium]
MPINSISVPLPNYLKSADSSFYQPYIPSSIPKPSKEEELKSDIAAILESPELLNAHIGISVYSISNSKSLYRYNSTKNFVPASIMKLLTTSAALITLGADFTYQNKLYVSGDISLDGKLIGDIIILGSGDPTLSEYFHQDPTVQFDDWIQQLRLLGINSINGNIIADDSYFDNEPYPTGWDYKDLIHPYAAQVSALNIFDNSITISISPADSIGGEALIEAVPNSGYVEIINNVDIVSPEKSSKISMTSLPHSNIIEVSGNIYNSKRSTTRKMQAAIDSPSHFFLDLFIKRLSEFEIEFVGQALDFEELNQEIDYSTANEIGGWVSPPLKSIIANTNKVSNNLSAETILKTIAREKSGLGSFENGIDVVQKELSKSGLNPNNYVMVDGSGLSRNNLLSPIDVTKLLSWLIKSKYRNNFLNSLAKPGEEGTLSNRLEGTIAKNRLKAKTGSLSNVSNIAGYVETESGEKLVFCIMVNNYTVPTSVIRNIQDLMILRLCSY